MILPEVADMKGVEQPEEFHPEGDVWKHTLLLLKKMSNPTLELAMAGPQQAHHAAVVIGVVGRGVAGRIDDKA